VGRERWCRNREFLAEEHRPPTAPAAPLAPVFLACAGIYTSPASWPHDTANAGDLVVYWFWHRGLIGSSISMAVWSFENKSITLVSFLSSFTRSLSLLSSLCLYLSTSHFFPHIQLIRSSIFYILSTTNHVLDRSHPFGFGHFLFAASQRSGRSHGQVDQRSLHRLGAEAAHHQW
jgi:hypothetical protein